jgi:hypothetical protein
MLEPILWGVVGLSCGVIGSTVHGLVEKKKRKVEAPQDEKLGVSLGAVVTRDVDHNTAPKVRIGVIEAMNGKVLEVATAIPNNHGHYDWKTEMYVIPEGQKLSEAISTVMLMKGLEK